MRIPKERKKNVKQRERIKTSPFNVCSCCRGRRRCCCCFLFFVFVNYFSFFFHTYSVMNMQTSSSPLVSSFVVCCCLRFARVSVAWSVSDKISRPYMLHSFFPTPEVPLPWASIHIIIILLLFFGLLVLLIWMVQRSMCVCVCASDGPCECECMVRLCVRVCQGMRVVFLVSFHCTFGNNRLWSWVRTRECD